jgi:hypothetical protein
LGGLTWTRKIFTEYENTQDFAVFLLFQSTILIYSEIDLFFREKSSVLPELHSFPQKTLCLVQFSFIL